MKSGRLHRRTELARTELSRSSTLNLGRGSTLERVTPLRPATVTRLKRTPLGHCTPAQKERVRDLACIVCAGHAGHCHPAHVIDSGSLPADCANDVRAVVPLCAVCHDAYDHHGLDLSPHLEPRWRDSLEWAVGAVGLFTALRRITNKRWQPILEAHLAPVN